MKNHAIVLLVVYTLVAALVFMFGMFMSNSRIEKAMAVEYCWDSEGQHYVAPSENCTH